MTKLGHCVQNYGKSDDVILERFLRVCALFDIVRATPIALYTYFEFRPKKRLLVYVGRLWNMFLNRPRQKIKQDKTKGEGPEINFRTDRGVTVYFKAQWFWLIYDSAHKNSSQVAFGDKNFIFLVKMKVASLLVDIKLIKN